MTIELRSKSQITVPREIVSELNLSVGDKFEAYVKDGVIFLIPVAVYPKNYVSALEAAAKETSEAYNYGQVKAFDAAKDLIDFLHEDNCDVQANS